MRIANNITAINSHRQYNVNATAIGRNMEKLSSGYRINRSADDSAGLAISEKMRAQIRGLNMASKNSQDAISLVQTAEGALQTTHDILQRMRELAVQAASDSNQNEIDREALNAEFQQMITEIDDTANKTKFNNMGLIDGNYDPTRTYYLTGEPGVTFTIQSGANMWDESAISIQAMNWEIITQTAIAKAVGYRPDTPAIANVINNFGPTDSANNRIPELQVNLHDRLNASYAITIVNAAVNVVSTQRALLGALQNRLEYKVKNLDISAENLQAAESRIRDADLAKMMTEFTKNNILFQASTAMLAQANALPQGVLQLLG
jgi:flagellin